MNLDTGAGDDNIVIDGATLTLNGNTLDLTLVQELTINGGGTNTFILLDVPSWLTSVVLVRGPGTDTVVESAGATAWRFTGPDSGTVSGADTFTFSGIENVTAGDSADSFVFANDGASLAGTLNAGGGSDTLDFSGRTSAVTVNLGTGTSTAIGTVSGIDVLRGSAAQDTLIGPDGSNTWLL